MDGWNLARVQKTSLNTLRADTEHFSCMAYTVDVVLIKTRINFAGHLCLVTELFLSNEIYDLSTGSDRFLLISQQAENRCSGLRLQNSPHVFPYNLFQFCQPA